MKKVNTNGATVAKHLGDLTPDGSHAEADEGGQTFEWFGKTMKVNALASEQSYVDFIEEAGELDERDPKAAIAAKRFLREIVHADDFDEFWRLSRVHRVSIETQFDAAVRIIEGLTERPTGRSSDSPPGPHGIAPSSTAASYSKVRQDLEREGRADLALVYLDAEERGAAS